MKDNNDNKFNIKEFLKDKQKRSILILTIYFVFFVCLVFSIRNNNPVNVPKKDDSEGIADLINGSYSPEKIELSNFEFEYKIMKDNNLYTYTGKNYNGKEEFKFDNNTYFKENDIYYKKVSDDKTWEEVENPYVYSEYLDFNKLNEILKKSEYISTTNYKDETTATSYKMYINETLTDNVMTITSKDNILQKIEITIDKDSLILVYTKQNNIADFNK